MVARERRNPDRIDVRGHLSRHNFGYPRLPQPGKGAHLWPQFSVCQMGCEHTGFRGRKSWRVLFAWAGIAPRLPASPIRLLARPCSPHVPNTLLTNKPTCSPTRHWRPGGAAPAAGPPTATAPPCSRSRWTSRRTRSRSEGRVAPARKPRFPAAFARECAFETSGQERHTSGWPCASLCPVLSSRLNATVPALSKLDQWDRSLICGEESGSVRAPHGVHTK